MEIHFVQFFSFSRADICCPVSYCNQFMTQPFLTLTSRLKTKKATPVKWGVRLRVGGSRVSILGDLYRTASLQPVRDSPVKLFLTFTSRLEDRTKKTALFFGQVGSWLRAECPRVIR